MKKLHLALLLACALCFHAAAPARAAGNGWLTTQWWVICTKAAEEKLDPDDCDDSGHSSAAMVKTDIENASQWLKELGFRGPKISHDDENGDLRYLAWVADESELRGTAQYDGSDLYIGSLYYVVIGEEGSKTALLENMFRRGAPTHELFHAVQNAYDAPVPFQHHWIGEGMAQAVLYSWMRRTDLDYIPVETRHWDIALSRPQCMVTATEKKLGCYATQNFWTWLGQHLESADSIQYLHRILEQDLKPDRGITGTDKGLREFDPEGLYNLYPEFIAQFATEREHYKDVPEITLDYRNGKTTKKTVNGKAQEVAASAHQIKIDVPEGEIAGLKIEFEQDHDNLHLVVDGERVDTQPGEKRNIFRAAISGNEQSVHRLIRVVNVAPEAGETQARKYTLKITLEPLDPCSAPVMDSAFELNLPSNVPALAAFLGETQDVFRTEKVAPTSKLRPNGDSSIVISGLISDHGAACTNNIAQLNSAGAQISGSGGSVDPQALKEQAEALMQKFTAPASDAGSGDMSGVMELMGAMQDLMAAPEGARDVVIHVYSPHVFTLMTGMTPPPTNTRHGGLAGWQANSAANLVMQLKGTPASELQEGQTYDALAVAPLEQDDSAPLDAIPTSIGFYTTWQGKLRTVAPAIGFEGTMKILGGRLTGTVTIDKMSGAAISGRYTLSGHGRLVTEQYQFTYDEDGAMDGSEQVRETRPEGPIKMEGTFSAPNVHSSPMGSSILYQPIIIK